jgi:hypothetical protein
MVVSARQAVSLIHKINGLVVLEFSIFQPRSKLNISEALLSNSRAYGVIDRQ